MAKRKIRKHRYVPEKHKGIKENNKCPYCGMFVKRTYFSIDPIGYWIVEHINKKQDCYSENFNE